MSGVKDSYNPQGQNEQERCANAIQETREFFPSMVGKSDKEVLDFLFSMKDEANKRELVMEGKTISGVYCDIEGTLLIKDEVNSKVLDILKDYESQGKTITLWTDGDIVELQKVLQEKGVSYSLKSKRDFAGAIAEIVIDNDDKNTFASKTRIFPQEFIYVS